MVEFMTHADVMGDVVGYRASTGASYDVAGDVKFAVVADDMVVRLTWFYSGDVPGHVTGHDSMARFEFDEFGPYRRTGSPDP